jgi:hypothetical protein
MIGMLAIAGTPQSAQSEAEGNDAEETEPRAGDGEQPHGAEDAADHERGEAEVLAGGDHRRSRACRRVRGCEQRCDHNQVVDVGDGERPSRRHDRFPRFHVRG